MQLMLAEKRYVNPTLISLVISSLELGITRDPWSLHCLNAYLVAVSLTMLPSHFLISRMS